MYRETIIAMYGTLGNNCIRMLTKTYQKYGITATIYVHGKRLLLAPPFHTLLDTYNKSLCAI